MHAAQFLVVSGVLLVGEAAGAVYKCTDQAGRVAFTSTPCEGKLGGDENRIEVKATTIGGSMGVSKEQQKVWAQQPAAPAMPAPPPRRNYCKSFSSTAMRSIVVSNGITEGMSASDVQRSWGAPTVVNSGELTQWVYRWRDSDAYVYFVQGCVWKVEGGYGG